MLHAKNNPKFLEGLLSEQIKICQNKWNHQFLKNKIVTSSKKPCKLKNKNKIKITDTKVRDSKRE